MTTCFGAFDDHSSEYKWHYGCAQTHSLIRARGDVNNICTWHGQESRSYGTRRGVGALVNIMKRCVGSCVHEFAFCKDFVKPWR